MAVDNSSTCVEVAFGGYFLPLMLTSAVFSSPTANNVIRACDYFSLG